MNPPPVRFFNPSDSALSLFAVFCPDAGLLMPFVKSLPALSEKYPRNKTPDDKKRQKISRKGIDKKNFRGYNIISRPFAQYARR